MEELRRGAERMGERASAAKEAMGERATAAKEAVEERATAAKEATAEAIAAVKPKLRGVTHEWAFFLSLGFGAALIILAEGAEATLAVAIYAVSLSALFGTSALYHRVNWRRPNVRRWMRRLDHSMIFFLIAGTYTPFALLVLHGTLSTAILVVVWAGAIAGAIVEMIWIDHPKWASALIYLSLGWVAVATFPALWSSMGVVGSMLMITGGLLYTAGAVIYAVQRPNPNPAVFGYHEIFHLLVIVAAVAHFSAVAFFALPQG
ncbi:MAG TPA: hemolysin III family protein [Solirubrobacterales bacterium]